MYLNTAFLYLKIFSFVIFLFSCQKMLLGKWVKNLPTLIFLTYEVNPTWILLINIETYHINISSYKHVVYIFHVYRTLISFDFCVLIWRKVPIYTGITIRTVLYLLFFKLHTWYSKPLFNNKHLNVTEIALLHRHAHILLC